MPDGDYKIATKLIEAAIHPDPRVRSAWWRCLHLKDDALALQLNEVADNLTKASPGWRAKSTRPWW